jgi:hypothetical protein
MSEQDKQEDEYQPRWYELITLQEASKLSGLSPSDLRLLVNNGELWAKYLGTNWFTTEQAIRDYLGHVGQSTPKSSNKD